MGFTGKYTIAKDFVREVRPKIGVPAIYRYETKPGIQAQVDWAECGYIEIEGEKRKLYCFTMVLGYSRMIYAELYPRDCEFQPISSLNALDQDSRHSGAIRPALYPCPNINARYYYYL